MSEAVCAFYNLTQGGIADHGFRIICPAYSTGLGELGLSTAMSLPSVIPMIY